MPLFLRPMIAQHASMVGSCLITIAPSWVLRKKDEPMTTALREAKSTLPQHEWRTIRLYDHTIKVITDNDDMDVLFSFRWGRLTPKYQ